MKAANVIGAPAQPSSWPVLTASFDASLTVFTLGSGLACIYSVAVLTELGLIDKELLKLFLSVACPLVTMSALVSPIPIVLEAMRALNAQNLPLQVFQSQAMCNILSICYGIQITNPAVLITNMFGLCMQVLYMSGDHYVRMSNTNWMIFVLKLSVILNAGLFIFALHTPINVLGHFITIFNIVLYAVPLTKLGSILKTRSASSLPTAMTCVNGLNNAVWCLYALLIEDMVVLLPSVLGFALSGFQVLVILWCNGSLPFDLGYLLMRSRDGAGLFRRSEPKIEELQEEGVPVKIVELPALAKSPNAPSRGAGIQDQVSPKSTGREGALRPRINPNL